MHAQPPVSGEGSENGGGNPTDAELQSRAVVNQAGDRILRATARILKSNTRESDVVARYACDPRRLYEIWEGSRFPSAQNKARALFAERYPGIVDRIDFGHHRRFSKAIDPDQMGLFD